MRASVAAAWPAFCSAFEGRCWWLYLDTKKLPTTGLGFLLETLSEAQGLSWFGVKDGLRASDTDIEAEYKRVKSLTRLAPMGGYAFKPSAKLRLAEAEIDLHLMETTAEFWGGLKRNWPEIEAWPADAQLAALDLAWQNGHQFTQMKKNGEWVWPNTRAAFAAQDWHKAASAVPGSGTRAAARKRLFNNAAVVVKLDLDRERLWDKVVPAAVPPVEPPPAPPVQHEGRVKPAHGSRTERVYVDRYGVVSVTPTPFLTTTRTLAMWLEAVYLYHAAGGATRPYWTQGGYNAGGKVGASAGTHDRDACDTSVKGMSARERSLWELSTWVVGFAGWLRKETWIRKALLWPDHWHGIPKDGEISDGAKSQVTQFKQARTGLVGWGVYARISRMGVGSWTWEDYLRSWGVSLSALQKSADDGKVREDVKELQWALSRFLGADVVGDGQLGPKTKAALAKVGPLSIETLTKLGLEITT